MKDTQHPKAIAAAKFAEEKLRDEEAKRLLIQQKKEAHDLHFFHYGATTFVYQRQRRNVYHFSTALCHPNDRFSKLQGRWFALQAMMAGRYVTIRAGKSNIRNILTTLAY
mgnify:FL=1